jgi:hypothetical protein
MGNQLHLPQVNIAMRGMELLMCIWGVVLIFHSNRASTI